MGIRFRAWLALLRPPNFFTVPGDALAGFLLAAGSGAIGFWASGLWAAVLAGVCFYAGGLLLNDWADFEVDRVERPQRPLPAGLVGRGTVLAVASGLLAMGLGLTVFLGREVSLVGGGLLLAVVNYNLLTKNIPGIGALNMGLCRAGSFLLGAVLAGGFDFAPLTIWGAGTLLAYIAAVTHVARTEMAGRYFAVERWAPAAVLAGAFFVYLPISPWLGTMAQFAVPGLFLVAVFQAGKVAVSLPDRRGMTPTDGIRPPVPVPALVGRLIGLLLPLQAAFVVGSGGENWRLWAGLAIAGLWPLKNWTGRIFYAS